MKKFLSAILAVIMIFSISVVGFALILEPIEDVSGPELIELEALDLNEDNISLRVGKGGTYYVMLDPTQDYTNIKVTAYGNCSASILDYSPAIYAPIEGITYTIGHRYDKNFVDAGFESVDYTTALNEKDRLNKENKTTVYYVKPVQYVNLIEIKVNDNFGAAYTEGKIKITGMLDKVTVSAEITVVNDVYYYNIETVKWAVNYNKELTDTDWGYSSYDDSVGGYAKVVSKSAFRNIKGKDITVKTNGMSVTIKDVAEGQNGLNFTSYPMTEVDKDKDGKVDYIKFGFYCDVPVKSKFVIVSEEKYTFANLIDIFNIKLEENDIITYGVYKDEVLYTTFDVDYSKDDINDTLKFIIDGNAGESLGEYTIKPYEFTPHIEDVTDNVEENPNTGAPINLFTWILSLIFS